KKRATCAASEDGTASGLRSSVSDISFMISDILRWAGMVMASFLLLLAAICRFDFDPLGLEPFHESFLQSAQRIGQRVGLAILEHQSARVQRSHEEAETFLVTNLDVPVAFHELGDGRELLGNVASAWRHHEDRTRTRFAHLSEEILIDLLHLGEFIVNRGFDAEIVQMPIQLFPARVAPTANVLGSAGLSSQWSA